MGYTANIVTLFDRWLGKYPAKSVLEFGDQIMCFPRTWKGNGKPTRDFYWKPRSITDYRSIDINGRHGAEVHDVNKPFDLGRTWELVTNGGFSEHLQNQPVVLENMRKHASHYVAHLVPTFWFWHEYMMYWFYGPKFFQRYARLINAPILEMEILNLYKPNRDLVCVLLDVRDGKSHPPPVFPWRFLRKAGELITLEQIL